MEFILGLAKQFWPMTIFIFLVIIGFIINLFENSMLENLIIQADTFQFNLLQLDIRQHSDCHEQFIDELLDKNYKDLKENEKLKVITQLIKNNKKIIDLNKLSDVSLEMYQTFKVIIENLKYLKSF